MILKHSANYSCTMVASASAIVMNCVVPVFVDIDPNTYTLNPEGNHEYSFVSENVRSGCRRCDLCSEKSSGKL